MTLLCANRAGRAQFVSLSAAIAFLAAGATATLADIGIAAAYPGDKNIASDPDVIFADDFESYATPADAKAHWGNGSGLNQMKIVTDPANVFSGTKSIEFDLPISTSEESCSLVKKLNPEQDTVFMRMYQKFDAGYSVPTSNHNGIYLGAHSPGTPTVPNPDGTGFYSFTLQNDNTRTGTVPPGLTELYIYWRGQSTQFGDHWLPAVNFTPQRDRWYCYELMVKANTPGQNDGEAKFWIDGQVVGDFPNLNLRSIPTLKMDKSKIMLHALHSERLNKKWHDNVVIATKYIGPMASPSPSPTPTPTSTAQLQNISSRLRIQTGNNVGIAGFVVGGTEPKKLLIRGLGPTLAQFNVTGVMQDPTLELHDGSGSLITTNDNWKDTQQAEITATQLAPPADAEAAILATLRPGAYTAIQMGVGGGTGVGLIEVYDVDPLSASRLINISTRGLVQTGNNVLIAGCSLAGGSGSNEVVIRALGPSLVSFGVNNALPNPVVTLYDSNANVIIANDNWKDSQQRAIENTGLQPPNDLDAAILATLPTGNYTAIVTDKNGSIGVGLVEVYATQ
jgi:hypothetical protein